MMRLNQHRHKGHSKPSISRRYNQSSSENYKSVFIFKLFLYLTVFIISLLVLAFRLLPKSDLPIKISELNEITRIIESRDPVFVADRSNIINEVNVVSDKVSSLMKLRNNNLRNNDGNENTVEDFGKAVNGNGNSEVKAVDSLSNIELGRHDKIESKFELKEVSISQRNIQNAFGTDTVLLIIASDRPEYLKRCLTKVLMYHPKVTLPIVISEDGNSPRVYDAVDAVKKEFESLAPGIDFMHIHHTPAMGAENGYIKLSGHFKWALDQLFYTLFQGKYEINQVIVLEEDLEISLDFYEYFAAFVTLLKEDTSILAVSAWNDNGQNQFVKDPRQVYRSDFFPGLGND